VADLQSPTGADLLLSICFALIDEDGETVDALLPILAQVWPAEARQIRERLHAALAAELVRGPDEGEEDRGQGEEHQPLGEAH
jgi:hypothetical protein